MIGTTGHRASRRQRRQLWRRRPRLQVELRGVTTVINQVLLDERSRNDLKIINYMHIFGFVQFLLFSV